MGSLRCVLWPSLRTNPPHSTPLPLLFLFPVAEFTRSRKGFRASCFLDEVFFPFGGGGAAAAVAAVAVPDFFCGVSVSVSVSVVVSEDDGTNDGDEDEDDDDDDDGDKGGEKDVMGGAGIADVVGDESQSKAVRRDTIDRDPSFPTRTMGTWLQSPPLLFFPT